MEQQKQLTKKDKLSNRGILIVSASLLAGLLMFCLTLFRVFSLFEILFLTVEVCFYAFVAKKRPRKSSYSLIKIVLIILIGSYVLSAVVRFCFISHDWREYNRIFLSEKFTQEQPQEKLGVSFPESFNVTYYSESIPWMEQNAELIADVNLNELSEITKLFEKVPEPTSFFAESKFWYIHYLFCPDKAVYKYSNYEQSQSGAVTADILVVLYKSNKAKLYMDIIYW